MLLLSESEHEDQLVLPVCALLQDLGLTIQPFEKNEAVAPVFWEISDFYDACPWFQNLSETEKLRFLSFIELEIKSAMITAGFQAIERGIQNYTTLSS